MASITKPFTPANGTVADALEVNAIVDTIYDEFNGGIDSENLANNGVNFSKINWGTGADEIDGTETTQWKISKGATNEFTITHTTLSADRTWTFPNSDDIFAGLTTTQTFENKTLTSPTITTPTISGNVAFDTDTLYVDATNNRIGVGTTSPLHKLHVIGSSGVAIHLSNSDDSDRGGGLTTSGAAGAGAVALNTSSSGYALTFGIDSIEKARIATDGTFIIGGVGTSIDATNLLQVYKSSSGANVNSLTRNTSNTSGSNANVVASVAGTSGGDPAFLLDITGGQGWYIGADNSDTDAFKIGTGSTVGSNVSITLTTDGDASFGRDLLITRNLTVSGSILSPTITTPTIASFANANHNHQDSAGGGALSTSAITSGTFADARIAASNVTQHQSSLTIAETQITDGSVLARVGGNETISGTWTFSNSLTLSSGGAFSGTISGNPTFSDGVTFSDFITVGACYGEYIELAGTSNSLLDLTMLDISGVNNHVSGYAYGITFSTTGGTLDSPFKFASAYRSTSALGAYYGKIAVKIDGVAGVKYIPLYD